MESYDWINRPLEGCTSDQPSSSHIPWLLHTIVFQDSSRLLSFCSQEVWKKNLIGDSDLQPQLETPILLHSGSWEFGPNQACWISAPRTPLRWAKIPISHKAGPRLSPDAYEKINKLYSQGDKGHLVKFEHLMTPYYLAQIVLGCGPLTKLRKLFYYCC